MKIPKSTHNHKLTNILKVLLFSLLMLLPFLDIGTRCSYVLLNKNAYQSYYGETINEKEYININSINTLVENDSYYYSLVSMLNESNVDIGATTTRIKVDDIEIISNTTNNNVDFTLANMIGFYLPAGSGIRTLYMYFFENSNSSYTNVNSSMGEFIIKFTYKGIDQNYRNTLDYLLMNSNNMYQLEYNSYSYLDNVFDYSIDKMANSPLYNWTTQTGMYTGVNAMTTGLGITTPLFAILITYWMFLTIIYIIIDIVISLFTMLTHIFVKKE